MNTRLLLVLVTCGIAAVYIAFVGEYEQITREHAILGTLVLLLGVLPSIVAFWGKHETGLMPLMPLHGLFYALTFGLPTFSTLVNWHLPQEDAKTTALLVTVFGLLAMYLGYYATRLPLSGVKPIAILRDLSTRRQIRVAWVVYGFYLAFELVPELRYLPSVGQLAAPLGYLSIGLLFMLALDRNISPSHIILLGAIIAFTLLSKLLSGSLAAGVLLMVFLGILHWNKKRSIPWHFVVVSVLIAILLNPVKMNYRHATWYEQTTPTFTQKLNLFYDAAVEHYSGEGFGAAISEDAATVNRLAHISLLSYVVSMTPDPIPYWMGESYQTLWSSFIPRVIWPTKPEANIGQQFGHRYGLLGPEDETTSLNLPWLPEFFANFGWAGVLFGMFGVGVLFRFLVHKFSAPVNRSVEHVLGIGLTFSLFYAESDFALMVGGLLLSYIAFFMILRVLTSDVAARAQPAAGLR